MKKSGVVDRRLPASICEHGQRVPSPSHSRWYALGIIALAAVHGPEQIQPPRDSLPSHLSVDAIPLGLDTHRLVPEDNPLTDAKMRLGRKLFFDAGLSADGTVSCASCHQPEHGFAGSARFAVGIGGRQTTRNAPSLLNRAYGKSFFWDGRETTLEAQALRPIEDPREMGADLRGVLKRLQKQKDYEAEFAAVFWDGITAQNLSKALASFERVLLIGNGRVDRFRAGDVEVLTASERHGLWLFESRGRCWQCHSGRNFTDEGFHNTGVSWGTKPFDLGRYEVTKQDTDRGRFKTPTLRGLTTTAPYMHDGSFPTLEEVVEFYNRGAGKNPYIDVALSPLGLSKNDIRDLVAFLKALSDSSPNAESERR